MELTARDLGRFWKYVRRAGADECWEWTGARASNGYGVLGVPRAEGWRVMRAHRISYLIVHGRLPERGSLDHLCRNRACVNPAHLEAVAQRTNVLRGEKGWSLTGRCRAGLHDMSDPANIRVRPSGQRLCQPCYVAYYRRVNEELKRRRRER